MLNIFAKCYPNVVQLLPRSRNKLHGSSLVTFHYSFVYPSFIDFNHVWANKEASTFQHIKIVQKRLIRTIICSLYQARTAPLFYANRFLDIPDINIYSIGTLMYRFVNSSLPDT